MKCARLKEWFGDGEFPWIIPQRGCVQQNGEQIEFMVGWFAGEEQCRASFAASPKSICQTSPRSAPTVFVLQPIEHPRPFHSGGITERNVFVFLRHLDQLSTHGTQFVRIQIREFSNNLLGAHRGNL
jgi:hypothetical protein